MAVQMREHEDSSHNGRIYIRTFGQFSVKRGSTVLSAESHK
jgi:hypothetical protein